MDQPRRWNILNTSFLVGTLALAAVAVPLHLAFNGFHWGEWIVAFAMVFAIGTAISAGYHRLFSHRAFKASAPVRFLLLCFGAASFENSALKWASDHRAHHQHVDDEAKDPYAIGKGFWYAHWTWVMEAKDHELSGVADLEKDPLVRWQHRHHFLIGAVVALIPVFIGLFTGHFLGYLVVGLLLRIVLTHHTTFLINSAAHVFGSRPYTDQNSARDNWILAPLTYGEGYHNFHHMWQWDYRNGVEWYHWDSTKWMLSALTWTGQVHDLRRVPATAIQRARLAMEEKRLQERLALASPAVATPMQIRLAEARLKVDRALAALHERREAWQARKAEWKLQMTERGHARAEAWAAAKAEWKAAMAQHRAELRAAWQEWKAARMEVRSALVYA
ncbi:MAG TPA: acyl-CoA desaturase [Holophagaceae bacterium]|nr:acyl-CoA desaturase [Holophagaceae bacterium]